MVAKQGALMQRQSKAIESSQTSGTRPKRVSDHFRFDTPNHVENEDSRSLLLWTNEALRLLTIATADLLRADRPESSFEQLFRQIMEHLGCQFYANYDYVDGQLQLVCSNGFSPEMTKAIQVLPIGALLCGRTACVQDLLYLPNARSMTEPHMQVLHDIGGQVFVGLPLRDKGELVGTLSFGSTRRSEFSDEELDFLRTLRNTVSAAKARYRDTRALVKSEARYRSVTESCLDGLIVVDDQGLIIEVNDVYLKLSGYERSELIGQTLGSLESEPNRTPFLDSINSRASETRQRIQTTHRTSCGREWPVELTISDSQEDGPTHFVVIRDLTERMQSEQSLRTSQERVRESIESANIVLWEVNPKTSDFTFVIGSTERLLGFTAEEWMQPGFWVRQVHPDDREFAVTFCQQATTQHKDHRFEYRMVRKDGGVVWVEDFVSIVLDDDRIVALRGVLIDITSRKRIEEQLAQSRKMEAIGRLAGGVAHDFNNLLTVINGYSELMQMSLEGTDPRLEWVTSLANAGDRAARLTDQLLLFARTSAVGRAPVEINSLVSRSASLLERLIGDDIHLEVNLSAEESWISADRTMLEQIIMNLVINSRDAMPVGGQITVSTELLERRADDFQVLTEAPTVRGEVLTDDQQGGPSNTVKCIAIRVSDQGIGMSEEQKARLFEPFYTTKEIGKGTGLGMAVVYGATRQNGGLIEVESELGRGTTVSILFLQTSPGSIDHSQPTTTEAHGKETILLVEDEEQVRNLVQLSLERQGYRVMVASNASDAIQVANEFQGTIDLLVTDVVMAGMGGRQLADHLRTSRTDLKVLYISGYTDDAVLRHGVAEGIDHFLRKPFTPHSLTHTIRGVLCLS